MKDLLLLYSVFISGIHSSADKLPSEFLPDKLLHLSMEKSISFKFHLNLFTTGKYNVDKITEQLKIEPTKKWVMDETNSKPLYRDESGWVKSSDELFGFEFEESFLVFFKGFKYELTSLKRLIAEDGLSCKIDVVIKIYRGGTMPSIFIDRNIMADLSLINCSLDFDIYDLRKKLAQ